MHLDARGIGHQAFYSMTEFQLRTEQMPKDIELLDARITSERHRVALFQKGCQRQRNAV